jgi:hypothetical protein
MLLGCTEFTKATIYNVATMYSYPLITDTGDPKSLTVLVPSSFDFKVTHI